VENEIGEKTRKGSETMMMYVPPEVIKDLKAVALKEELLKQ